jgi:mRNA-degrading endonuclease RelE of RelBE toxin-antitoxin system
MDIKLSFWPTHSKPPSSRAIASSRGIAGFWSLRVGDYRAIYEIDRTKKRVIVLFIGHGKRVYDDFSKML